MQNNLPYILDPNIISRVWFSFFYTHTHTLTVSKYSSYVFKIIFTCTHWSKCQSSHSPNEIPRYGPAGEITRHMEHSYLRPLSSWKVFSVKPSPAGNRWFFRWKSLELVWPVRQELPGRAKRKRFTRCQRWWKEISLLMMTCGGISLKILEMRWQSAIRSKGTASRLP